MSIDLIKEMDALILKSPINVISMTRINRDNKMQCLQKIKYIYIYSIKIILYFLHLCTNTQGGTGLLISLRKGTDQPFKVIGHLLSLIKVCILDQRRL